MLRDTEMGEAQVNEDDREDAGDEENVEQGS